MSRGKDPDRGRDAKYVKFYEMPLCNNGGCGETKVRAPKRTSGRTLKSGKTILPQDVLICPICDGGALELASRAT